MIPVIVLGLGGLIWYSASKQQQLVRHGPRMSPALRAEFERLLERELPPEKLESLASEFERAHYHREAALLGGRARKLRALAQRASQSARVVAQTLHARLDGEYDSRVLRRIAEALEIVGQSALAREVMARAQSLESETRRAGAEPGIEAARGASIEDLLRVTQRAAEEDLDELERFGGADDANEAGVTDDDVELAEPADDVDDQELGDPDHPPGESDAEFPGDDGRSDEEMIAATFAAMEQRANGSNGAALDPNRPSAPEAGAERLSSSTAFGKETMREEAPRASAAMDSSATARSGEFVTADGVITTVGVPLEDSGAAKLVANGSKAQRRRVSSKRVGGYDGS